MRSGENGLVAAELYARARARRPAGLAHQIGLRVDRGGRPRPAGELDFDFRAPTPFHTARGRSGRGSGEI